MSTQAPLPSVVNLNAAQSPLLPEVEKPLAVTPCEVTPDEAAAVEAVFAQQQESDLVAGLLGLWTGALVLHDVAVETFSPATDEEKDLKRKKHDEIRTGFLFLVAE